MKVIKFGGKSLSNEQGLANVLAIIKKFHDSNQQLAVVVSARGNSTNDLIELLDLAKSNKDYQDKLKNFKDYQLFNFDISIFQEEFYALDRLLEGVRLLGDYNLKIKDQIIAFGELIAAKYITTFLNNNGLSANFVDSRKLIITDNNFGNAQPIDNLSAKNVTDFFKNNLSINVITGFIGATINAETTTLGRNGSNFTASLIASYINAEELLNYTHVDGIFTANPDLVPDAVKIDKLSFNEANELANFGANILHAKTILPLIEKNIPLRILNTFNDKTSGTLITSEQTEEGIKALSVLDNVSLINLEGRGLLGKTGVDARIFRVMAEQNISVSIISQGSSERGIGLVVKSDRASDALIGLEKEFENDFYSKDVNRITVNDAISVVSIIGQDLSSFHKPYNSLIRNKIVPILFNNTTTGRNISLVIQKKDLMRALNVIHGEIFVAVKKINIAIFGNGLVGGTLINQIVEAALTIEAKKKIKLNIFAVANSKTVLLNKLGIDSNWKSNFSTQSIPYTLNDIIEFADKNNLENLIAVDNTASKDFVQNYITLIESGFDLVSSNKVANTLSYNFYKKLRVLLAKNQKSYLYETNVGAGLPLIDTIKLLHLSGENITKIKGVFSGSLSFLFNNYSTKNENFSEILKQAISNGYTEPDPREDLCGNDVARKLLILARELELQNEFDDIKIENLIPASLQKMTTSDFLVNLDLFDDYYFTKKTNQDQEHVLRYIGELSGDLQQDKGNLEVKLVSVPQASALGQLKGSDSIFEIYTESYGERPIVVQGAGAGASVTARGVFGDILRLTEK